MISGLLPIAFYGTLLEGLPAKPGRPRFEAHGRYGASCLIPGVLYDTGPFPALVAGAGVVCGQLWQPRDPAALALLDEWEDCHPADPAASIFIRTAVTLVEPRLRAWTYRYNRPVDDLPRIESGDWREKSASCRCGCAG
jgi:gamma-glutamylcyclotransferase (GGCT)/AIG2-like uncharacterized protein YtfP